MMSESSPDQASATLVSIEHRCSIIPWLAARPILLCMLFLTCEVATLPAVAGPPALDPDDELSAKLLKIAGDGFKIKETRHFTIAYNTGFNDLATLTGRLEGIHNAIWKFCDANGLATAPPSHRLGILLFNTRAGFERYCKETGLQAAGLAGLYWPENNLAAFYNTYDHPGIKRIDEEIERIRKQIRRGGSRAGSMGRQASILRTQRDALVERFNRFVIQHEAVHQMMFNLGIHKRGADNPTWMAEGLACLFEVPQGRSGKILGRANAVRLADFRDSLGVSLDAKRITDEQYSDAFRSGRVLPIADLVGDPDSVAVGGRNATARYAQTWAFVFYLHREHREKLAHYITQLSQRKPGVAISREDRIGEFEATIGPLDDDLQRRWVDYTLKLRLDRREAGR